MIIISTTTRSNSTINYGNERKAFINIYIELHKSIIYLIMKWLKLRCILKREIYFRFCLTIILTFFFLQVNNFIHGLYNCSWGQMHSIFTKCCFLWSTFNSEGSILEYLFQVKWWTKKDFLLYFAKHCILDPFLKNLQHAENIQIFVLLKYLEINFIYK